MWTVSQRKNGLKAALFQPLKSCSSVGWFSELNFHWHTEEFFACDIVPPWLHSIQIFILLFSRSHITALYFYMIAFTTFSLYHRPFKSSWNRRSDFHLPSRLSTWTKVPRWKAVHATDDVILIIISILLPEGHLHVLRHKCMHTCICTYIQVLYRWFHTSGDLNHMEKAFPMCILFHQRTTLREMPSLPHVCCCWWWW